MGLFWNIAGILFVLAVLPFELLSPCRNLFVVVMSASVMAAIFAENRRMMRPD